jgi:mutator protein MutT
MRTEAIPVAAGIIRRGDLVLITRRPRGSSNQGLWEFPGGKKEPGETIEECLRRELREELGIEADIGGVLVEVYYPYDERPIRLVAMICNGFTGEPSALGCDELRWVAPEELSSYRLCPADRTVAKALVSNKTKEG